MSIADKDRIVVTGMGAVSPLGCGVETVWSRLLAGCSGIGSLGAELAEGTGCAVGGRVPDRLQDPEAGFDSTGIIAPKDLKKMDRFVEFALVAAHEALEQAGWREADERGLLRTATVIATGIGGFGSIVNAVHTNESRGPGRLSPFTAPTFLANMAAGQASIRYGFKGPQGAPVTACAAGVQAIGDAARLIRSGEADIALCGGAEAAMHRVSLGGFAAAKALSTSFNDTPHAASRPFDEQRDGFVMSEGAGLLVIERLDHALARGATPLAELVGYGTTSDAYHLTAGPDDGSGARRAMEIALTQAGISPDQVHHINAHATSTQVGDRAELAAMRALFGSRADLLIAATKSSTGHLLGGAGGIEAIFTVLALRDQIVPATLNLEHPDALAAGLSIVCGQPQKADIQFALTNGFGFGGVNASALFKRL
ncbi:beta-ketoacyl-ACP synthase II [Stenotrophomonas sp. CFBP 13718]|uniref:beta-ketoacyl-ACP synthase II n=1 Tax=Stenotrophomonas sp. CFBP 13718 TaxID=2775304 RepID=UPI00177B7CA7|nr:beta-ketoacyl-ACP synthase II [Stenotrophomonas sp. CFBP 13718]MBD8696646.1 beta-ketoacyl-ACP synthase II [Stenotrophomonas sp. CFBP 13718]